jgi:catechol 2,3-dioxygenase-like lactoylglutathione lyase family enzyme
MFTVRLSPAGALVFATSPAVAGQHVAFGVSETHFQALVERLRAHGITFGNDPEEPANGATDDPLGGRGRVYFTSPDGHFLEVAVTEAAA